MNARFVFAVIAIASWLGSAQSTPAQDAPPPPKVTVALPLESQVVDHAEFTGRFQAIESVTIQAQVTGYLSETHFIDGQMVAAGDLLFVIDPRPFEAAVASARANLQSARATADLANLELQRGQELVADGAVSQEAVDTRRANAQRANAAVTASQADLRLAELDLAYTQIVAPVSGRISSARIDIGNLVVGGAGSASELTSIVSVNPVHFTFDISESDYLAYGNAFGTSLQTSGDTGAIVVGVRLLDETDYTREGLVDVVDNAFDTGTGTIRVRALFSNADGGLVPGLFGRLRMPASRPYQALLIPDKAVLSDQANRIVMVVLPDNTVESRTVTLGTLYRGLRVILAGLKAGERVIVDGLLLARAGQKVTPEETTISLDRGS